MKKTNTLMNLVTAGLVGVASILPGKGLEGQVNDETLNDSIKIEQEETKEVNFNIHSDLANKSRFWGLPFLESPKYAQTFGINYNGFLVSLAGDIDVKKTKLFNITSHLGYSKPISKTFTAHAGALRFDFNLDEGWDKAFLGYISLAANTHLNPSITYNRLVGFGDGEYIEGDLSKKISLNDKVGLRFSGKIGYNAQVMRENTGFSHVQGTVEAPLNIKSISINPYINYFGSLSDEVNTGFTFGFSANSTLTRTR